MCVAIDLFKVKRKKNREETKVYIFINDQYTLNFFIARWSTYQ